MKVIPGATLADGTELDCDVVVVGSGGGGAPAAYELATAGLDVIVLEAGPFVAPSEFTQRELDTLMRFYVDQGGQGPADGSLTILQGSMVGGSTVVNGEVCFRTPDYVLDEWARDHGVPGMSSAEMAPVFDHVERMINVTVNQGRYVESAKMVAKGMRALGIEPKPISRNVKDCRGCPYCFFGCAYGCKQSMDQSYLPRAEAAGARLVSDARVVELQRAGDAVAGVQASTPAGTVRVRARATVLACGAIHTPLLLADHGLGGDQVGRNLAVHPVVFVTGWYDEAVTHQRAALLAMYSDAYVDQGVLFEFGSGSPAFGAPGVGGFGEAHKRKVREIAHAWAGGGLVRDVSMPGVVRRDRKGRKVIDYKLPAEEQKRLRVAIRGNAEIHFAGGAREVTVPTTIPFSMSSTAELGRIETVALGPADISLVSYHPQGTARLGTVTDYDGQVRGAANLYVMDTSLFPSPTGVNPQVSVMAVSTVLARKLAARLGPASAG